MKKERIILLIIIITIVLILLTIILYLLFFITKANTNLCNYSSETKNYIKKDPNCVINFLCIKGTTAFHDNCGCGCEKILDISLNCTDHTYYNCPSSCVVCPPCAVCSSLSCNTPEFCNSIGFNETWYKNIKNRI